ncbi:hypothetical protein ACFFWD_07995 [Bradyrhizobium erythrophlei]|uniref:hypothetical protein n=1 Tax=Bradyrhizobium erythrophlei TaxID=1437360 RepID=UPI0035EDE9C3
MIILAASGPITAQALLLGLVLLSGPPSPECVITGSVNHKGERLYHSARPLNFGQINLEGTW